MIQLGRFAYCKPTKNGRDMICQKLVFSVFIKISKCYLNLLGYCTNIPRDMCTQSELHTENTHTELNYNAAQCAVQFHYR